MTPDFKRAGLIAAISLIGAAACGNDRERMDEALKHDLAAVAGSGVELAPKAQSQVVISAIEAGQTSARAVAARKTAPKAPPRAVPKTAIAQAPEPSHASQPTPAPERRSVPAPVPSEPAPLPASRRAPAQRQQGTYKTEAEIFRQMPWIKP